MDIINQQILEEFNRVRLETRARVNDGSLPANLEQLSPANRFLILAEEIGEIAQNIKIKEGLKPRIKMTQKELTENLEQELLQSGAIILEWLRMENVSS